MTNQFKKIIVPLLASMLVLIFLEIFSTAILPAFGIEAYKIPFHILLTLFMAFKLETVYLPFLILIMQYVHSFFSIEGWEMGTIAGVFVCILIAYFKDILHFSSYLITVVVTQISQAVWFGIVSLILYFKGADITFFVDKFWRFIPESIVASLIAPIFFSLFDKIWNISEKTVFRERF